MCRGVWITTLSRFATAPSSGNGLADGSYGDDVPGAVRVAMMAEQGQRAPLPVFDEDVVETPPCGVRRRLSLCRLLAAVEPGSHAFPASAVII